MNRTLFRTLALVGLIGGTLLTRGAHPPTAVAAAPTKASYAYDFEQSVKPWIAGPSSMLQLYLGDSVCPVSSLRPAGGAAQLTLDGGPQVGPVLPSSGWILAAFPAGSDEYVSVDFAAKALSSCATGCSPQVYVGTSPPTAAQLIGGFKPLDAKGWHSYHYGTRVVAGTAGTIYVALGVAAPPDVLDSPPPAPLAVLFDCVTVQIRPF